MSRCCLNRKAKIRVFTGKIHLYILEIFFRKFRHQSQLQMLSKSINAIYVALYITFYYLNKIEIEIIEKKKKNNLV